MRRLNRWQQGCNAPSNVKIVHDQDKSSRSARLIGLSLENSKSKLLDVLSIHPAASLDQQFLTWRWMFCHWTVSELVWLIYPWVMFPVEGGSNADRFFAQLNGPQNMIVNYRSLPVWLSIGLDICMLSTSTEGINELSWKTVEQCLEIESHFLLSIKLQHVIGSSLFRADILWMSRHRTAGYSTWHDDAPAAFHSSFWRKIIDTSERMDFSFLHYLTG